MQEFGAKKRIVVWFAICTGVILLVPVPFLYAQAPSIISAEAIHLPSNRDDENSLEWWRREAMLPMRQDNTTFPIDVNAVVLDALMHSARIRAIQENVTIAETSISTAKSGFDPKLFMESKFSRVSVPTGSTLDAGLGQTRLREKNWFYQGGVRKRQAHGGTWELAQRLGTRDSTSQFFSPVNQGNAKLALSFTQPLRNGSGVAYNRSMIVLASLDTQIAAQQVATELQDYLLSVTDAHWDIYLQRTRLLQKRKSCQMAEAIHEQLFHRRQIDASEAQIIQVRAIASIRNAELVQAEANVLNAESTLRALVNSPILSSNRTAELIPIEAPMMAQVQINLDDALVTALSHRPEIDQSLQEIESARVRISMARNELCPVLDLVVESYVSGLRGDYDVGQSWSDQFSQGEPTYAAGLVYERPVGMRFAKAQLSKRQAEARQMAEQFRGLTENIRSEVEIAVRNLDAAYRRIEMTYESLAASTKNVESMFRRWQLLPGEDRSSALVLQDLLESQDRVTEQEAAFVQAQIAYVQNIARLNRATGQLLSLSSITAAPAE